MRREQGFEAGAQGGVARAGTAEKGSARRRRQEECGLEQGLFAAELGFHGWDLRVHLPHPTQTSRKKDGEIFLEPVRDRRGNRLLRRGRAAKSQESMFSCETGDRVLAERCRRKTGS